jgi:hypothetical protein
LACRTSITVNGFCLTEYRLISPYKSTSRVGCTITLKISVILSVAGPFDADIVPLSFTFFDYFISSHITSAHLRTPNSELRTPNCVHYIIHLQLYHSLTHARTHSFFSVALSKFKGFECHCSGIVGRGWSGIA